MRENTPPPNGKGTLATVDIIDLAISYAIVSAIQQGTSVCLAEILVVNLRIRSLFIRGRTKEKKYNTVQAVHTRPVIFQRKQPEATC